MEKQTIKLYDLFWFKIMQRRFIKIDSAENLYNETQLALNVIDYSWDDIYYIRLNGELTSIENFRTITETVSFDPFNENPKVKQIIICFKNSSQLIRSTDKNFRICYCYYDVNSSNEDEDIEKELDENYVKIRIFPDRGRYLTSGKEYITYFLDTREEAEEVSFDDIVGNKIQTDFESLRSIGKNKGNSLQPIEVENEQNVSSSSLNRDSMSEEELDEYLSLSEKELNKKEPEIKYRTTKFGSAGGYTDSESVQEENKFIGYYIDGTPYKNNSGHTTEGPTSRDIIIDTEDIDYNTLKETYVTESVKIDCSWDETIPDSTVSISSKNGFLIKGKNGEDFIAPAGNAEIIKEIASIKNQMNRPDATEEFKNKCQKEIDELNRILENGVNVCEAYSKKVTITIKTYTGPHIRYVPKKK